jgi:predicted nucleic acid-binding protein
VNTVFCRLLSDASEIKDYILILERLGLERIGNGSQLFDMAAEMAKEFKISGYDTIFAAASLVEGVWLTADKAAVKN